MEELSLHYSSSGTSAVGMMDPHKASLLERRLADLPESISRSAKGFVAQSNEDAPNSDGSKEGSHGESEDDESTMPPPSITRQHAFTGLTKGFSSSQFGALEDSLSQGSQASSSAEDVLGRSSSLQHGVNNAIVVEDDLEESRRRPRPTSLPLDKNIPQAKRRNTGRPPKSRTAVVSSPSSDATAHWSSTGLASSSSASQLNGSGLVGNGSNWVNGTPGSPSQYTEEGAPKASSIVSSGPNFVQTTLTAFVNPASPAATSNLVFSNNVASVRSQMSETSRDTVSKQLLEDLKQQVQQKEAEFNQQLEDERSKVRNEQKKLASCQHSVSMLTRERTELLNKLDSMRPIMIELLRRDQGMRLREEARAECQKNTARLGQLRARWNGQSYGETFQDGTAIRDVQVKLDSLAEERTRVDEERSTLTASIRSLRRSGQSVDDASLREEILVNRLVTLAKEETDLREEKKKLDREKVLHIRELKRIRDEDRSSFSNFNLLDSRYLLLNLLGRGGFSEVYKAVDIDTCGPVVCKIHEVDSTWQAPQKEKYLERAIREQDILGVLDHPNIVKKLASFRSGTESSNSGGEYSALCTVLEYCSGGDLDVMLKSRGTLSEREARIIIIQILRGLKHLDDRGIIHYDLKPGNVLFANSIAKISDFGLSKRVQTSSLNPADGQRRMDEGIELTSQGAGTYWYLPPECFEQSPRISTKVDVWSAGVVLYQMLFGKKPFGDSKKQEDVAAQRMISRASVVEFPVAQKGDPKVSPQAKEFISYLLTPDPERRPDIGMVLDHAYVQLQAPSKNRIPAEPAASAPSSTSSGVHANSHVGNVGTASTVLSNSYSTSSNSLLGSRNW